MRLKLISIFFILFLAGCILFEEEVIKPSARNEHNMAYQDNKIILFGGYDWNNPLNDTWEFNTLSSTWSEVQITGNVPPARYRYAMANIGGSKLIIFGGDQDGQSDFLNDTWEYNILTQTWTEYNITGTKPSARKHTNMVYVGNNKIILFGGMDNFDLLNDTWEFDTINHTWTELVIVGDKPSKRVSASLSYIANSKIILFGGSFFGEQELEFNETWIFDSLDNTWTKQNILGDTPTARHEPSMAFAGENKIIMYGGNHLGGDGYLTYGDTWEYNLLSNSWTEYNIEGTKPPKSVASAICNIGNDTIIMHGGGGSDIANQTWKYNYINHIWTNIGR